MNNKSVTLIFLTMILFKNILAQNNLELIEYFEAVKIISSYKYNLSDTPVVAIIDKGINLEHEDLSNNIWINKHEIPENGIDDDKNAFIDDIHGWNFDNNTSDVSIGGIGNWHGTPVNGIIGAVYGNNLGVKGICPGIKLMNIVKGESVESIISSLHYIYSMRKTYNQTKGQKGAYIVAVNCSWGKDSLWAADYPEWCALYDSLGTVGVLCVNSVPNDNIDIDVYGDMPSTCNSEYLITVTNSTQYDTKIYDAAFGQNSVDIAAPGDNTYTALNTGAYGYFGGTSAAAPYVTGAIGLMHLLPSDNFQQLIANDPTNIASIIKKALIDGADKVVEFQNITVSGGRLNIYNSMKWLCNYFGEEHLYSSIFENLKICKVYPNPATTQLYLQIESNEQSNGVINITDLKGGIVFSQDILIYRGINSVKINFSGIKQGMYIICLTSQQENRYEKIVIQ